MQSVTTWDVFAIYLYSISRGNCLSAVVMVANVIVISIWEALSKNVRWSSRLWRHGSELPWRRVLITVQGATKNSSKVTPSKRCWANQHHCKTLKNYAVLRRKSVNISMFNLIWKKSLSWDYRDTLTANDFQSALIAPPSNQKSPRNMTNREMSVTMSLCFDREEQSFPD